MFAQGKLGRGVAVIPTVGELRAPIDGKVTVTFPSGHAYAVRGKGSDGKNVDVLMHIGFDTVNLDGEHFTPHARKGDVVKQGDLLCEFDIPAITAAGYEVTTPMVISNYKKLGSVLPLVTSEQISAGDLVLAVEPKPVVEAQ